MSEDYSYFKDLTQRQQLNDLMHKYAQINNVEYGVGWKELEKRYHETHGEKLSIMKWKHEQDNHIRMTMPVFLEAKGIIHKAIIIGHEMTGGMLLPKRQNVRY